MMPMPASAAAMQIQVRSPTRSRISSQPSRPAKNGAAAWMNRMLATVVYSSAKMKQLDAVAKQQADDDAGPAQVAKRLDHFGRDGGWRHRSGARGRRSRNARTAWSPASVSTMRPSRPPVLQTTAAAATRARRCGDAIAAMTAEDIADELGMVS